MISKPQASPLDGEPTVPVTPHVVFVDDERQLLDSLRDRLHRMRTGWDMRFYDNAQEASVDLENAGPAGAVLVTDWMMPGTDGLTLCKRFATSTDKEATGAPRYYVILVTGKQGIENIVEALDSGADDFIAKPFDARELVARIRVGMRVCCLEHRLREANEHLVELATTDPLTSLLNRRRAAEILDAELERSARGAQHVAVALADVDHFKNVNDTLGHEAGDIVLKVIAQRLQQMARRYDAVVRWGGEEFLVICPHAGHDEIQVVAERMRSCVAAEPIIVGHNNNPLSITVSIGTAVATSGIATTADALVAGADHALYEAKHAGRDTVRCA